MQNSKNGKWFSYLKKSAWSRVKVSYIDEIFSCYIFVPRSQVGFQVPHSLSSIIFSLKYLHHFFLLLAVIESLSLYLILSKIFLKNTTWGNLNGRLSILPVFLDIKCTCCMLNSYNEKKKKSTFVFIQIILHLTIFSLKSLYIVISGYLR